MWYEHISITDTLVRPCILQMVCCLMSSRCTVSTQHFYISLCLGRRERAEFSSSDAGHRYPANDQEIAQQLSIAPWHSLLRAMQLKSDILRAFQQTAPHPRPPFLHIYLFYPPLLLHPSPNTSTLNVRRSLLGSNGVFMPETEEL